MVRPGDIVLLHDPQTAGLAAHAARTGAHTSSGAVTSAATPQTRSPTRAGRSCGRTSRTRSAFIFSRRAYAPDWVAGEPALGHPALARPLQRQERRADARRTSTQPCARPGSWTPARTTAASRSPAATAAPAGPGPPAARSWTGAAAAARRARGAAGQPLGPAQGHGRRARRPSPTHLDRCRPTCTSAGRAGRRGGQRRPRGRRGARECHGLWAALPAASARRVHLCLPADG